LSATLLANIKLLFVSSSCLGACDLIVLFDGLTLALENVKGNEIKGENKRKTKSQN
jgi:hypothetical protein